MTSQPINQPKPHQKVELVTLNKFAKFHHYTPINKKLTKCTPLPGCDEPKKPGLDRVKAFHSGMVLTKMNIYLRLLRMVNAYNCVYGVNAELYDILPYH